MFGALGEKEGGGGGGIYVRLVSLVFSLSFMSTWRHLKLPVDMILTFLSVRPWFTDSHVHCWVCVMAALPQGELLLQR